MGFVFFNDNIILGGVDSETRRLLSIGILSALKCFITVVFIVFEAT